jgi:hypothetical protein
MDYENVDEFLEKPKSTKNDKPVIDKRQIDYLKKLKTKLESGVNVRIIPKTKQALKDLFGIDADSFKINPEDKLRFKKNTTPFIKTSNSDEEYHEEYKGELEDLPDTPIKEGVILPKRNVTDDDKELLNKLISDYLFKNMNLINAENNKKEVVVIHKHYHYNAPNDKKVVEETKDEDEEVEDEDEDEDDEDEDVDEDVKEVVDKSKIPEKDLQFSQAFLNMVQENLRQQLLKKSPTQLTFV